MKRLLKQFVYKLGYSPKISVPQGEKGILEVGHRRYVGGMWDEIGKLQFDFLVKNGLKEHNIFLDIACGSLRAGRFFIPYLGEGNYLGIDKEQELINLGLENEIEKEIVQQKRPEFIVSNDFEFHKFSKVANFAIAQSLFTHLPPKLINTCFQKLRESFDEKGVFFATYFITEHKVINPSKPHDHGIFSYTKG